MSVPAGEPASAAPEAAPPAKAKEPSGSWLPGKFSGSVALTSNYMSRGITQTDNDPAIQGTWTTSGSGLLGTMSSAHSGQHQVGGRDAQSAQHHRGFL